MKKNRKLVLHRETIRELLALKLSRVAGGLDDGTLGAKCTEAVAVTADVTTASCTVTLTG